MSDQPELVDTLRLLFALHDHKTIAESVFKAVPPEDKWTLARECDAALQCATLVSFSVDQVLEKIKDEKIGTFIGDPSLIWDHVRDYSISDNVYEEISLATEELIDQLTTDGHIRPYKHHVGCTFHVSGDVWGCTCKTEDTTEVATTSPSET